MLIMQWKSSTEPVLYPEALDFMQQRVEQIHKGTAEELVWLLEHPPLYTAGTSAKTQDLIDPKRFDVFEAGRGGEYTYHGPGQRIAYVMLNLRQRQETPDIRKFVTNLEQWIINTLAHFGITGERREGRIGIWVTDGQQEDKIAALGVRIRHGITFHGISINLNPKLEHFSGIVPCGISQHGVTSFEKLGIHATREDLDNILQKEFVTIF